MKELSICLLTYKRPSFLSNLLRSIYTQVWMPSPECSEVVTVDTDPDCSAQTIVKKFKDKFHSEAKKSSIKIFMLTSSSLTEDITRAYDSKIISGFFTKPLKIENINEAIH